MTLFVFVKVVETIGLIIIYLVTTYCMTNLFSLPLLLCIGTEPPSLNLLNRRPYKRNANLINNKMIRNIIIQVIYQIIILLYILYYGYYDFEVNKDTIEHDTIIFNTFVFCQIFNELNARSIDDNNMNIFSGLSKNPLFLLIIVITIVIQYIIIQYGGDFVHTTPLNVEQWVKCVLIGSLSLPLG